MTAATRRMLYMSGSMGLGHVSRDLAIVRELRDLRPDIRISWLASPPASDILAAQGEELLPECVEYARVTADLEGEDVAGPGRVDLIRWLLKVRKGWERNARLWERIVSRGDFALTVGNETYEIMLRMAGEPQLAHRHPFVIMYNFLGLDRVGRGLRERAVVLYLNYLWSRLVPELTAVFLGELEDIRPTRFGPFLPDRRRYASEHFQFAGHAIPFRPAALADRPRLKTDLGYGPGPLVVCACGGTAVGKPLLELCGRTFPLLRERVPDLRMVLVGGPRIPPASLEVPPGVEVRGFVPRLYEHFAASDAAVVQGGSTSTLELIALGRPFVYFPLEGHFEQLVAVAERCRRLGAGDGDALLADLARPVGRRGGSPSRSGGRLPTHPPGRGGRRRPHHQRITRTGPCLARPEPAERAEAGSSPRGFRSALSEACTAGPCRWPSSAGHP